MQCERRPIVRWAHSLDNWKCVRPCGGKDEHCCRSSTFATFHNRVLVSAAQRHTAERISPYRSLVCSSFRLTRSVFTASS